MDSGQIVVLDPAAFLVAVLDEHQELMAAALEHLASNRRRVTTVADELERKEALRGFVRSLSDRLL